VAVLVHPHPQPLDAGHREVQVAVPVPVAPVGVEAPVPLGRGPGGHELAPGVLVDGGGGAAGLPLGHREIGVAVAVPVPPHRRGREADEGVRLRVVVQAPPRREHVVAREELGASGDPSRQIRRAVAVRVAPGDRARLGRVGQPPRVREDPAVVAVEAVRLTAPVAREHEIEIAVQVVIGPGQGPRAVGEGGGLPPRDREVAADVLVDRGGGDLVALGQIEVPVPVHVSPRDVPGGAAPQRLDVRRRPGRRVEHAALVDVDLRRPAVVADREVRVAVAVPVAPAHRERRPGGARGPERRRLELAVHVVVEAVGAVAPAGRPRLVARHQLRPAVAVPVGPGERDRAVVLGRRPGGGGLERPSLVGVHADGAAQTTDRELGEAVAVDVRPRQGGGPERVAAGPRRPRVQPPGVLR
jgi:hypothetical protein